MNYTKDKRIKDIKVGDVICFERQYGEPYNTYRSRTVAGLVTEANIISNLKGEDEIVVNIFDRGTYIIHHSERVAILTRLNGSRIIQMCERPKPSMREGRDYEGRPFTDYSPISSLESAPNLDSNF